MIASEKIEKSEERIELLIQWTYAYHTFLVWNICTTFWVANSALIPAVAAFTLNSLFMTIPRMAAIWTGRFFNKLRWLSLPVLDELGVHSSQLGNFGPWLSIGNSFASNVRWIQWYEFTGIFGGALGYGWSMSCCSSGLKTGQIFLRKVIFPKEFYTQLQF